MDLLDQLERGLDPHDLDFVTWAESKKYCGKILYPRQRILGKLFFLEELTEEEERILDLWIAGGRSDNEISISPYIRERTAWLKENGYKHFREVVLVGGRRCSKGFLTGLSMGKLMFDTLALGDPGAHYGIDPDKEIYFSVVAAALDQAKEQQYSDLTSTILSCTAMQRNVHRMLETEFSVLTEADIRQMTEWKKQGRQIQKDIAKLRGKALPANSRTLRGSTTLAICFDEFAHFQQGENDQSDSEVYAAAVPALAQFGPDAMIFCNSSPFSKVGKFHERYEEGMATDNGEAANNTILSIRLPSWALFEGWWEDPLYVGPKKCVTVSPDWNWNKTNEDGSFFYVEEDRQQILIARNEEAADPRKFRVERRGHFAEVVDAYLDPLMVDRMFLGRPYEHEVDEDDDEGNTSKVIRVGHAPFATNWDDATYRFDYRAHIDPSSTTAGFGFALGHVEYFEIGGRLGRHVVFDVIRRWDPKHFEGDVIDWDPILSELLGYCECFRPKSFTFDQHQTAMPMQWLQKQLRKRGIETRVGEKVPNIQSNWNRAEVFRTALYQDLVHAPSDTPDADYASQELKHLQEIRTSRVPRVEKQDVGKIQTKDLADSVMEVVESCIGNEIAIENREELMNAPVRVGAQGGYAIGKEPDMTPIRKNLKHIYSHQSSSYTFQRPTSPGTRREQFRAAARRSPGGRPIPRSLPQRSLPNR